MKNFPRERLSFQPPRMGWLRDIAKTEIREADYFETGALLFSITHGWLLLEQRWRRG
jgi:hypothetical protein